MDYEVFLNKWVVGCKMRKAENNWFKRLNLRFEVLTAVNIKIAIFRDDIV
jgi:hypothetical protein